MTVPPLTRILPALPLCLLACSADLEVVDTLEPQTTSALQPEPSTDVGRVGRSDPPPFVSRGPLNVDCACAVSAGLQPLVCNGELGTLLGDGEGVQTTADGSRVAFVVEEVAIGWLEVAYWNGAETRTVADGMLAGLSATGDRLLVGGTGGTVVLEPGGARTFLTSSTTPGRGALSASGDYAVGESRTDLQAQLVRADTHTGNVEVLGGLGQSVLALYATPDAAHVVGSTSFVTSPLAFAFRWSSEAGLTMGLPGAPPETLVKPQAISNDGSVIVGRANGVFRWSEVDGFEIVAGIGGSEFLSADGAVMMGSLQPGDDPWETNVFRWTRETGVVELMPGVDARGEAMSADGSVIVAHARNGLDGAAPGTYIWDEVNGARSLVQLLATRGVDTTGWQFEYPRKLSADGKVLLGFGRCGGVSTLYRVVLSD